MTELQQRVKDLMDIHGEDTVIKAITVLSNKAARPIPTEFIPILDPLKIQETISQLDASSSEVLNAIKGSEGEFEIRKGLLKEKELLATEIELVEAEALMQLRGEAKSQFVMIGDEKVAITNDQARDAYRKTSSKAERKKLSEVSAELAAIDAQAAREKDYWNDRKAVYDNIRTKGKLQASLLDFLK